MNAQQTLRNLANLDANDVNLPYELTNGNNQVFNLDEEEHDNEKDDHDNEEENED
jgi:hypothetical protein